jgi:hypothetical protein
MKVPSETTASCGEERKQEHEPSLHPYGAEVRRKSRRLKEKKVTPLSLADSDSCDDLKKGRGDGVFPETRKRQSKGLALAPVTAWKGQSLVDTVGEEWAQQKKEARRSVSSSGEQSTANHRKAPDVEGDKVVAERFRTKLCRSWLQRHGTKSPPVNADTLDGQGCCPYQSRCMFAHGEAELRTAKQNLEDGLTSESAIKEFKRKEEQLRSVRNYYARLQEQQSQQHHQGIVVAPLNFATQCTLYPPPQGFTPTNTNVMAIVAGAPLFDLSSGDPPSVPCPQVPLGAVYRNLPSQLVVFSQFLVPSVFIRYFSFAQDTRKEIPVM